MKAHPLMVQACHLLQWIHARDDFVRADNLPAQIFVTMPYSFVSLANHLFC